MELLCDIKSINILNYRKDEYAMMLFNSSKNNKIKKIPAGATGMSASGKQLIYRMKFISQFKKPGKIASLIAIVLVSAMMLTALTNPIGLFNSNNNWAQTYAQFAADEGIYDFSGKNLSGNLTALEYAELLISSFKNINLPPNSRAALEKLTPEEFVSMVKNANIKGEAKLTRQDLAYMTNRFFAVLDISTEHGIFTAEAEDRDVTIDSFPQDFPQDEQDSLLTFMPRMIVKSVFEAMMANTEEGRARDKLYAYFSYKDPYAPDITDEAIEELLIFYPISETVPIYVFDPHASQREIDEILGYLNLYGLTNADIIKMNIEYSIMNNVMSSIMYYKLKEDFELTDELKDILNTTELPTFLTEIGSNDLIEYILSLQLSEKETVKIINMVLESYSYEPILPDSLLFPQSANLFIINGNSEYSDKNKIADYAKQSVEKLYSFGIMTGISDSKFSPNGFVTWGQSAKIISTIICALVTY
jgi:hypothetical protein